MIKSRLDLLLLERSLFQSREQARRAIQEGRVSVNGKICIKPGEMFAPDAEITVAEKETVFVSRGGYKLEKALDEFGIVVDGLVCADIGASTGGFTDCMLQRGARKVYAIDAGHGQLEKSLLEDSRVISMEKVNFRYAEADLLPEAVDFAAVDVSFISLTLILEPLYGILKTGAKAVCLIKPQFEAGREHISGNGVVHDVKIHQKVIQRIESFAKQSGFDVTGVIVSPVKEKNGNTEYLMALLKAK
jgi:23S rRNA (cytidine1920-2'-O)/16S rRNA (cytidine1409-2'-O)-methyltransferase